MKQVTLEKTRDYLIVKIPLGAVEDGRAELSPKARKVLDTAIAQGLADIEAGRVFGPFGSVKEFKAALQSRNKKA